MFFAFHTVETETPALAEMCQGSCREEVAQRNSNQISLHPPPPPALFLDSTVLGYVTECWKQKSHFLTVTVKT